MNENELRNTMLRRSTRKCRISPRKIEEDVGPQKKIPIKACTARKPAATEKTTTIQSLSTMDTTAAATKKPAPAKKGKKTTKKKLITKRKNRSQSRIASSLSGSPDEGSPGSIGFYTYEPWNDSSTMRSIELCKKLQTEQVYDDDDDELEPTVEPEIKTNESKADHPQKPVLNHDTAVAASVKKNGHRSFASMGFRCLPPLPTYEECLRRGIVLEYSAYKATQTLVSIKAKEFYRS
ncbi:hypothetical protein V1514DRAFT_317126 [Lipomyces japonicus]|uniref:uncharacterized protein n=1 Tax=Lipomyces japonicus TaxID=56871 RepID=UPI0034CECFF8